jgi:phospholipid/cholesterol/gamma-HCH transport system ATP-binding protein
MMIRFDKVVFTRGRRRVLDGISFSVEFDERMAVLGASGEGKSTIMKLLTGLETPDGGNVWVDGEILSEAGETGLRKLRRNFGVVFQEEALFDSMTVAENVAFPLREAGMRDTARIESIVVEVLRRVGLEEAIGNIPSELSGGMKRRVAIARALVTRQARMFLYDEPTAGLDPVNAGVIRDIILEISRQGKGFIMVTHSVTDALLTARRFLFLDKGEILVDGDESALLTSENATVKKFTEHASWRRIPTR